MARRRRRKKVARKGIMAVSKKFGKMEWELFILVMLTLIIVGAFSFF